MKNIIILKLTFISSIIGLISGVFIGIFLILLERAVQLNLTYYYLIFILPLSGVFMTYLYRTFGENSQKGNNLIIENINGSSEEIKFIMAPLVFLGTVLTHLFGGSVGREGTGVQIGGTIGAMLSKIYDSSIKEKKILLISGVAAGFSAVFGTPLSGTLFALEIANIGSISYNAMVPAITSAIIGDRVVRFLGVKHTIFDKPPLESFSFTFLLKVVVLAVCFGLASRSFVFMTNWFKKYLEKYCKNPYIKIFVGGSLMVIATLVIGNRAYNNLSLGLLKDAFIENIPAIAFIVKLVLTTLCIGSGYQGGEVTPLFVIGATLGTLLSPIIGVPVVFAASLGLVGVFSGATNAPLASFMMYLELFGVNNVLFALLVCILSVFISGRKGIYNSQLWRE